MIKMWRSLRSDESGQDLVEYALLLALIALIVIGAVTLLGQNIQSAFDTTAASLPEAARTEVQAPAVASGLAVDRAGWRRTQAIPARPTTTKPIPIHWAAVNPAATTSFTRQNSTTKRSIPASAMNSKNRKPSGYPRSRWNQSRRKIGSVIPIS